VPVIASRVSGNMGMFGKDYAGYYAPGNERALARLLWRAESDAAYYRLLRAQCRARRHLVTVGRERESLRRLLAEISKDKTNRQKTENARRTRMKSRRAVVFSPGTVTRKAETA
jgi:glycosyltransferase involved in cell wall biosynthesis